MCGTIRAPSSRCSDQQRPARGDPLRCRAGRPPLPESDYPPEPYSRLTGPRRTGDRLGVTAETLTIDLFRIGLRGMAEDEPAAPYERVLTGAPVVSPVA